jgi:hypothetical protein
MLGTQIDDHELLYMSNTNQPLIGLVNSGAMAIEDPSLAPADERAEVSGGTEGLRALLAGYASVLETIDDAPPVLWASRERPRILRWLRFPAPRTLVSILVVRHVSRCISALKRGGARRVALADDAPGPLRDLKMLEKFEQSLPTVVRLAVIAPLALISILFVAYILANFAFETEESKPLADFTTAAIEFDPQAAVAAVEKDNTRSQSYGMAMLTLLSLMLVSVPLLPAFWVKRRLLRPLAGREERGFAALGCRRVHNLELDLLPQLTMTGIAAVSGFTCWAAAWRFWDARHDVSGAVSGVLLGAVIVALAALASVELRGRYAARRTDTPRRRRRIMRVSLWLVWVFDIFMFIYLGVLGHAGELRPAVGHDAPSHESLTQTNPASVTGLPTARPAIGDGLEEPSDLRWPRHP